MIHPPLPRRLLTIASVPQVARRPFALVAALGFAGSTLEARAERSAPSPGLQLAVVVSTDGLSFDRLKYYRPWYVGGLKRRAHCATEIVCSPARCDCGCAG